MRPMQFNTEKVDFKSSMKKLIKSLKKYYLQIIISTICTSISVVLSILAPGWLSKLTNTIVDGAATQSIEMSKILYYAVILIVFYVSNAILNFLSGFIMNTLTQKYSKDLRQNISRKINKMPLSYFDKHAHGDTLSRVTNDIDTVGQSLQQSVTMLIQSVLMLVGVLIAMFITSWQMALTALATIPLIGVMLLIITKFAMPLFKKRQVEIGEINSVVEENFSGQLIIKAFNAQAKKGSEFDSTNEKLYKTMFKAQFFGGLMQPMMSFVSYFAYAAVCLVGGLLMTSSGTVTFGTITAFLVYVNLFQSPLSQIAQSMNTLQMAAASSSRVFEFLEQQEISDESGKQYKLLINDNKVRGQIEFKKVCFGYSPDKIIIPNFSAKINPGMKVAIVGPTGAGKTTLVNLLMRFYDINSGDITIDGVSIFDMPRSEVREIFGMVLQDTWMFEGTLRDNIVFNQENVSEQKLKEVIKEANLEHFVSTLPEGLDTYIGENQTISAGQKQLITIARALIQDSPLLILDEATSNVDTRTEILIQQAMDSLTEDRTSFVIAHRLSTIKNADLIVVMNEGNIIESGSHEDLLENKGFYYNLYNSQFEEEPA